MKTLGLIGGMSWESTLPYYRTINQTVQHELGGLHSARLLLYSVDFAEVEALQHAGDWDAAGQMLAGIARKLESAGAEAIVICTNTMHKLAPQVEAAVGIPLLHIVDATAAAIGAAGFSRVGLLGTRFTMEQDFYRGRMRERFGIETLVPPAAERDRVHQVIYEELCRGVIRPASREAFRHVLQGLADAGAQGVILGCTEISLLVSEGDSPVPVFDTAELHARAAARWAMAC